MMKFSQRLQVGLEFFEFLKETNRASITNKDDLKDVYNTEFRIRSSEARDPNFGSLLYTLSINGNITRRKNRIRFNATVPDLCVDQWYTPKTHQPQPSRKKTTISRPDDTVPGPVEPGMHVQDRRKLASLLMKRLKTERAHFIADKRGISITADHPFKNGKLHLCVEDADEYRVNLKIENIGKKVVHFIYYTPLQWLKCLSLTDEHKVVPRNPLELKPGDSYEIQVKLSFSLHYGFYPVTLAFEFKLNLEESTPSFHIVRFIESWRVSSLGVELKPTAPYTPRSLPAWTPDVKCTIVDGEPPEGLSVTKLKQAVALNKYTIPTYMNLVIEVLKKSTSVHDKRRGLIESPLSWENYVEKFHLLLYLEELQMKVDIKKYNIPNETMKHAEMVRDPSNKKLLILDVPGVAENRPSVLRGDQLLVCPVGETDVKYQGFVHNVELNRVKLGFSSQLLSRFVDGMKFSVEFTINRLVLRLQHRAAELAVKHQLGTVLFPAAANSSAQEPQLPDLKLCDRKLEANTEQFRAVQHIVSGSSKPAPYLVFGPPGTGKTVTVVEAIKQIEKTQSSCHILACAPSNSAADLLCSKILDHVDEFKVYRMYASSRDPRTVQEKLKACSNLVGDCYEYPPREKLMEYKIMVTTLITAGRLVTGGIPEGHFTHVFIDEAGHAVETESLVALAGLVNAKAGQVVLAGDPKQLGPILRSPFALKYGLGVSLLERMMRDFPLYQKCDGVFDSRFVTKLLCNYRSHPAILEIPNELYYDGELQCHADEILRNSYCQWELLPKKGFPLIFHGVTGVDERESTSPSFFNIAEVEVLMSYVKKLLQTHGKKRLGTISPGDIGIIAPYRKQVQKIRQALDKVGKDLKLTTINAMKIGSVEEFQGQERKVILVSTVRSSADYTHIDKEFNLGFVKNEKRFNVAVTRAKALLIVVGNPRVLTTDATWARFIKYCSDRKGFSGIDLDNIFMDDDEGMVLRLSNLYINTQAEVETEESAVQQLVDPEWRSDH